MNRFCVVLIGGVVLFSSCNIENVATRESETEPNVISSTSTVSETSSIVPTVLSSDDSKEERSSAPQETFLVEELPELTQEEMSKKDELVPAGLWNSLEGWATGENFVEQIPLKEMFAQNFNKPLDQVTFGEVWRYNHAGQPLGIAATAVGVGGKYPKSFPDLFRELKSIEAIKSDFLPFSGKAGDEDWSNLAAMTWLKELDLTGGTTAALFAVPEEIKTLKNLETLNLRFNWLEKLPDIFDSFPKLEYLNLDYSTITELPPSVYRLKNLKYLNLNNSDFGVVPASISQLQSLEELSLASHLYKISEELCNLPNLKVLKLGQWGIRYRGTPNPPKQPLVDHLPENIGKLDKLEVLVISDLPIKSLPASFVELKSLRDLTTNEVPLESLPEDIGNMSSLEGIEMVSDQIKDIPESFKDLPNFIGAKFSDEQVTAKAREMIGSNK